MCLRSTPKIYSPPPLTHNNVHILRFHRTRRVSSTSQFLSPLTRMNVNILNSSVLDVSFTASVPFPFTRTNEHILRSPLTAVLDGSSPCAQRRRCGRPSGTRCRSVRKQDMSLRLMRRHDRSPRVVSIVNFFFLAYACALWFVACVVVLGGIACTQSNTAPLVTATACRHSPLLREVSVASVASVPPDVRAPRLR